MKWGGAREVRFLEVYKTIVNGQESLKGQLAELNGSNEHVC